jgi:DNA modification methylase
MGRRELAVQYKAAASLLPYAKNARKHSKKQVRQIADSIERFGFTNPVLITGEGLILAGHGRVLAARLLGLEQVPTILVDHLTEPERRAYILADNKLALNSTWDTELLGLELQDLVGLEVDLTSLGFSLAEIDFALDGLKEAEAEPSAAPPEDHTPELQAVAVTRRGDLWQLGNHCLVCGDAREPSDYAAVLFDEPVDMIFTDPPYNCPISGHVSGLGRTKHREFAMASGEMSEETFTRFLESSLSAAAACCKDGAIAFVCMDWRGAGPLIAAGKSAFTEMKQLCVWSKTNGGMGTFYRSKHELVFVFKVGTAPHTNSFGLGDTGRYRTNVWEYPGISSITSTRAEELALHPTVKPVALVADAIRDCSKRGDIILDPFGGSGTTLIAAEKCGRGARLIEYDPLYCDTIIRRWEKLTGKEAVLMRTQQSFEESLRRDLWPELSREGRGRGERAY